MSPYPIIERRDLPRIAPRFLLPRRRDPSQLPKQSGGTVLVASVDDKYELLSSRTLSETSDVLVNASSVTVVDIRPSTVVAQLEITSEKVDEPFVVNVTFLCQVTDPMTVASTARDDITPALVGHLRRDSDMMSLGRDVDPESIGAFERHATARITAWCIGRPPSQPGMTIKLDHVEVLTPDSVRDHARALATERRRQELMRIKSKFSYEQADLIELVLNRGPEAIEALYLELGDERYAHSAERAYGERDVVESRLRELIGMLSERGHFDRVAVDTPRLMNEFVDNLLQSRVRRLRGDAGPSVVLGDGDGVAVAVGAGSDVEGDDELDEPSDDHSRPVDPPDEDTFDG